MQYFGIDRIEVLGRLANRQGDSLPFGSVMKERSSSSWRIKRKSFNYSLELPRGDIFSIDIFVNIRKLYLTPMDMLFTKSDHSAQDNWIRVPTSFSFG